MSWNYAELSKIASEVGGPEELVKKLMEAGRIEGIKTGRMEMIPLLFLSAFIGVGICKIYDKYKVRNIIQEQETEDVKKELIKHIEDYDTNKRAENEEETLK